MHNVQDYDVICLCGYVWVLVLNSLFPFCCCYYTNRLCHSKTSLKIPKRQPEAVNWRRTNNAIKKKTKGQNNGHQKHSKL